MDSGDVRADIGIIGGSGLYELDALLDPRPVHLTTPYGNPSDALVVGSLSGRRVAFLPRHGANHRISPSQIPARANIYALKSIGVRHILSISAVGSLREDLAPGHLALPDQIVDRTKSMRENTFFDDGLVVHVPFADPYCARLRSLFVGAARGATTATVHDGGTYCCIEGPQFSTRAESTVYRAWALDMIGMTAIPEAKLAREAELCYAGLAMVTDYDCWRVGHEDVTAKAVSEVMRRNGEAANAAIVALMASPDIDTDCDCHKALADSIITPLGAVTAQVRERAALLVGKYL